MNKILDGRMKFFERKEIQDNLFQKRLIYSADTPYEVIYFFFGIEANIFASKEFI